ncbi:Cell division protein MraZ [Candidatus Glomeribacter gigasporarum BEG34]|uniref:Transcriptional regulator MraZ n=1 Tax=Candidatus Glomeribacter gigasporarum BEG34 TaxID=1070319 RepID=G2J908_9BURK|nr:division/cell wall cluster transcriptional repressor MraZ [Candidatus Glomeribacter gigasporarum]CCD29255.1 Cell division protein MraZ [Candidatus Glomeribacter gigasporarum BEG34]
MFQGASALSLDAKGRMSIPARYREALNAQAEGRITLTKHPDGCLLLFPAAAWETFRHKIAALPMDAHWWRRIFLGNASEVEIDGSNRVLISSELRSAAALDKEVMLLGMGGCFEIWDAHTYIAKERIAMTQEMPDALKHFTF